MLFLYWEQGKQLRISIFLSCVVDIAFFHNTRWGFIQCENYAGLSRVGEEALARSCAKVNLHDWDKDVGDCANGSQGQQLLQSSVQQVKHLKIEKSCSIIIS
jgi:16S rRNA G966 N2-methylase RsmD